MRVSYRQFYRRFGNMLPPTKDMPPPEDVTVAQVSISTQGRCMQSNQPGDALTVFDILHIVGYPTYFLILTY